VHLAIVRVTEIDRCASRRDTSFDTATSPVAKKKKKIRDIYAGRDVIYDLRRFIEQR
jgi:hypothetical protein